jgi:hypothetical protein
MTTSLLHMDGQIGALIGVAGVVLGTMIAGVFQVLQTRRQRRWARQDHHDHLEHAHEDRNFDLRRTAYAEFLRKLQKERSWMAQDLRTWLLQDRKDAEVLDRQGPEQRQDELDEYAEDVGLFGSDLAYAVALQARGIFGDYLQQRHIWAADRNRELVPTPVLSSEVFKSQRHLDDVAEEFRTLARAELRLGMASDSGDDAHTVLASRIQLP